MKLPELIKEQFTNFSEQTSIPIFVKGLRGGWMSFTSFWTQYIKPKVVALTSPGSGNTTLGTDAGKSAIGSNNLFLGPEAGYQLGGSVHSLSGQTVINNRNLPSFDNRSAATTAITVANGAAGGNTYLYYNEATNAVEAVRLPVVALPDTPDDQLTIAETLEIEMEIFRTLTESIALSETLDVVESPVPE